MKGLADFSLKGSADDRRVRLLSERLLWGSCTWTGYSAEASTGVFRRRVGEGGGLTSRGSNGMTGLTRMGSRSHATANMGRGGGLAGCPLAGLYNTKQQMARMTQQNSYVWDASC